MPVINELKEYKNIINGNVVYSTTGECIESIDPSKDISMREVYGLDPAKVK